VKPAPFDYRVSADLGHTVALLDATLVGAKALAGGQSLVGSLRRCAGYEWIVRASEAAARSMKGQDG
jgi:xanthine dehydrogenase iron-sulfur cluster and FAD-binding subunit A